jgi:cbb3-type cytochrome oxidase cytochrome c subunit
MADNKPVRGHERIETNNFLMTVLILIAVAIGGIVEIVPLFFQKFLWAHSFNSGQFSRVYHLFSFFFGNC